MLFIVRFTDRPDGQEIRKQYMEAHIAWLGERKEQIPVAGSLREDVDAAAVGGCWIVKAADKSEVETLYRTDPFWVNGLRQQVEILHWFKAFPDEEALV